MLELNRQSLVFSGHDVLSLVDIGELRSSFYGYYYF